MSEDAASYNDYIPLATTACEDVVISSENFYGVEKVRFRFNLDPDNDPYKFGCSFSVYADKYGVHVPLVDVSTREYLNKFLAVLIMAKEIHTRLSAGEPSEYAE